MNELERSIESTTYEEYFNRLLVDGVTDACLDVEVRQMVDELQITADRLSLLRLESAYAKVVGRIMGP